ncbi:MAG: FAD-dependent oxidoreductase [Rhodospirillaceae bacterium]
MRKAILDALQQQEPFDLLVIGGGATGCGIAVDAASRGLRTALLERNDFAGGTSCRSTKLVHGGVRYLEAAVRHLDVVQYKLVREGLHERGAFLRNAPHLAQRLELVTPIYSWFQLPYVYAGLKVYDMLSGAMNIGHSTMIGRRGVLKRFPSLKAEGLKGGVVYYDGQFNDIRMAMALVLTARDYGAVMANYVGVAGLLHDAQGRICGAEAEDRLSGARFEVRARAVVNATGPFADSICRMDDPGAKPILKGSSGVHIILGRDAVPLEVGFLIPETDDGRVLFLLPWQGHILIGTTDEPVDIVERPEATQAEIDYLLDYVRRYFNADVGKKDVKAAWCGIRPLVFDPKAKDTAALAREHVIIEAKSGLLTIAGGKWTIYRLMAEHAVDRAIAAGKLAPARGCTTHDMRLIGSRGFTPGGDRLLAANSGLPADVAEHLYHAYGDQSEKLLPLVSGHGAERLSPAHPFLEAEVLHAIREEQAVRAEDVLVRRMTLALLDGAAAQASIDRVVELMAAELGWDEARCAEEREMARSHLGAGL